VVALLVVGWEPVVAAHTPHPIPAALVAGYSPPPLLAHQPVLAATVEAWEGPGEKIERGPSWAVVFVRRRIPHLSLCSLCPHRRLADFGVLSLREL
jgi:hypothetical protein